MPLCLGVDAGGTNTTYLLADDDRELARVKGPTIKRMRVSAEEASKNLHDAVEDLEQASGMRVADVASVCVGTAGETVPLVRDWIASELAKLMPKAVQTVLGDVEIALDAAFPGKRGVLALAGTGSNVCGRASNGAMFRAGGYGPAIADQGSGYFIGREALRRVFLERDRGNTTLLTDAILRAWGLQQPDEMIAFAHTLPPPDFSKLSRLVVECSERGDAAAQDVLRGTGADLGEIVLLTMQRVMQADGEGVPPVAIAGSVLEHVPTVRDAMTQVLHQALGAVQVNDFAVPPVEGALWRAKNAFTK